MPYALTPAIVIGVLFLLMVSRRRHARIDSCFAIVEYGAYSFQDFQDGPHCVKP